jgi:hypothetical protein
MKYYFISYSMIWENDQIYDILHKFIPEFNNYKGISWLGKFPLSTFQFSLTIIMHLKRWLSIQKINNFSKLFHTLLFIILLRKSYIWWICPENENFVQIDKWMDWCIVSIFILLKNEFFSTLIILKSFVRIQIISNWSLC